MTRVHDTLWDIAFLPIPNNQSINQSMHMRVLSPMWEVALIQLQEFLENSVITQFIIYKVKQNH